MAIIGTLAQGIRWSLEQSSNENRLYLGFLDKDNNRLKIGEVFLYLPPEPILARTKNSYSLDTDDIGEEWARIFSSITELPENFLMMLYRGDIWCS